MSIECGKCLFFKSFDNSVMTVSYGFCKVLKMAVYKDAVEDCSHGKEKQKKETGSDEQ